MANDRIRTSGDEGMIITERHRKREMVTHFAKASETEHSTSDDEKCAEKESGGDIAANTAGGSKARVEQTYSRRGEFMGGKALCKDDGGFDSRAEPE